LFILSLIPLFEGEDAGSNCFNLLFGCLISPSESEFIKLFSFVTDCAEVGLEYPRDEGLLLILTTDSFDEFIL
jgi:hypothetical protein